MVSENPFSSESTATTRSSGSKKSLSPHERQNSSLLIGIGILMFLIGTAMYMGIGYYDVFGLELRTTSSAAWGSSIPFFEGLQLGGLVYYGAFIVGFLGFVVSYSYLKNKISASPEAATFMGIVIGVISFVISNRYLPLLLGLIVVYILIIPFSRKTISSKIPSSQGGSSSSRGDELGEV